MAAIAAQIPESALLESPGVALPQTAFNQWVGCWTSVRNTMTMIWADCPFPSPPTCPRCPGVPSAQSARKL